MRILLIEDDPVEAVAVREALLGHGGSIDLVHHARLTAGRTALADGEFDCVLIDLDLPDSSGLDTLRALLDDGPSAPVVVLSPTEESGDAAIRAGAQDHLPKHELTSALLVRAIRYAVGDRARSEELRHQADRLAETERRLAHAEARLRGRADRDTLTEVLTGHSFAEHVTDELTRLAGRRAGFGLLLFDLDDFGAVNAHHGHLVGDEVLVATARRIAASVRAADLVGRLGGDRFAVFCAGLADRGQLAGVAERLIADIRAPVAADRDDECVEVRVDVSVGIVAVPDAADGHPGPADDVTGLLEVGRLAALGAAPPAPPDLTALLDRAEAAMQAARRESRRWHLVTPDLDERRC